MAKLSGFLFSLFLFGIAHAEEIKDSPIPEPNYIGIIIFFALSIGIGGWYTWRVMTGGNKDKGQVKK